MNRRSLSKMIASEMSYLSSISLLSNACTHSSSPHLTSSAINVMALLNLSVTNIAQSSSAKDFDRIRIKSIIIV